MSELIDRKIAVQGVRELFSMGDCYCDELSIVGMLNSLPSAEPERRKGKFLGTEYDGFSDGEPVFYEWECSECGCIFEEDEPTYNFCPNCGADMRGE